MITVRQKSHMKFDLIRSFCSNNCEIQGCIFFYIPPPSRGGKFFKFFGGGEAFQIWWTTRGREVEMGKGKGKEGKGKKEGKERGRREGERKNKGNHSLSSFSPIWKTSPCMLLSLPFPSTTGERLSRKQGTLSLFSWREEEIGKGKGKRGKEKGKGRGRKISPSLIISHLQNFPMRASFYMYSFFPFLLYISHLKNFPMPGSSHSIPFHRGRDG